MCLTGRAKEGERPCCVSYEDVVLSDLICLSRAIHRVIDLFVSVHFYRARQRVCV